MKIEKIMINEKEIEIKELKVKHIKKIVNDMANGKDLAISDMLEFGKELLPSVSNISIEEIEELAFSEVESLLNLFWKVNASFLRLLDKAKITNNLSKVVEIPAKN